LTSFLQREIWVGGCFVDIHLNTECSQIDGFVAVSFTNVCDEKDDSTDVYRTGESKVDDDLASSTETKIDNRH